jgi:predicted metal-dependent hydrolase
MVVSLSLRPRTICYHQFDINSRWDLGGLRNVSVILEEKDKAAAFRRGIEQFNAREFWEAHESWELVWLPSPEPDKTFLQGIIQVSAGFYHYEENNLIGASSLLRRGLEKIEQFPESYRGLRLEELRLATRAWLTAIETHEPCPPQAFPKIVERAAK